MTKAEVQGNIRYNENLVTQYRNNISHLEAQIRELERLRAKFQNLQSTFGNKQSRRKNKLASVFSSKANVKMLTTYASAMNGLLTGSEYKNAYNGLSSVQEKINSQIRSLSREINQNNENLNYRIGRISYWKSQLQYATDS